MAITDHFMDVIEKGSIQEIEKIMAEDKSIIQSAIITAVRSNHTDIVKLIFNNYESDPNMMSHFVGGENQPLIQFVVENKNIELV